MHGIIYIHMVLYYIYIYYDVYDVVLGYLHPIL